MLEDVGRQLVEFQDLSIQNIPRFKVFLKLAPPVDGKLLDSEQNVAVIQEMPITCTFNYSLVHITCDPFGFSRSVELFYFQIGGKPPGKGPFTFIRKDRPVLAQ